MEMDMILEQNHEIQDKLVNCLLINDMAYWLSKQGAYFFNHVGDFTPKYFLIDCIISSNDCKLMIRTLFFEPCAHCNDIMIRLVIKWSGILDGVVIRVVPSQQTGFIVFAVFIFDIEVYKKCVIRTATISGNGTQ